LSFVNDRLKAHLALLGANLFYGASFTIAKQLMPRLGPPLGFIFVRVSVVMLLFWLSFFRGGKFRTEIAKKDWPTLVMGGLFGVALNQMTFFLGLNLTFPIHAALIMMSTPLVITIISLVVLKERLGWDKALGILLGMAGAMLLMSAGQEITVTGNSALGDLLVFINAASYSVYLVIIKPLMQRYRPIIVIRWVFFFGFLFVLPFCWEDFGEIKWEEFSTADWWTLMFIIFCVTFLTYLWNIFALKHLNASTAGAYIYLQPIFAAIVSMIITGEELTAVKIISSLLIFGGVFLVNYGIGRKKDKGLTLEQTGALPPDS
jgi:drug/metabolite transporter (DMT)-like permease